MTATLLTYDVGSSTFGWEDLLTKLKAVYGTGSGLDADLLDSYHASTTPTGNTIPVVDSISYQNNVLIGVKMLNPTTINSKERRHICTNI